MITNPCRKLGGQGVDVLALDDFGAQSDAPWAREKLYQLVNYRVHPDAQQPAHGGHVQEVERKFCLYHSRSASRLKAAVHVHISAPGVRGMTMIKTGR